MIRSTKMSTEDYLEAILILTRANGHCRNVDIANYFNFSKPSITVATQKLAREGFITIEPGRSHNITLTEAGLRRAENVYERHRVLTEVLEWLGVDKEIAEEDACKIEHDLSDESFEKVKRVWERKGNNAVRKRRKK